VYIGFATALGGDHLTLSEVAKWAGEHEFDCLEVNVGKHLDPREVIEKGPDRINKVMSENSLFIGALAPMLNLLDLDPKLRKERAESLREAIDASAILKSPVVVTYGGSGYGMYFWGLPAVGGSHPSNKVKDNLKLFAEVYGPLAEYARSKKVKIAFETAPRGGGHGNIAHAPELWEMMFEAVPSEWLGLSLDPSHLVWLHVGHIEDVVRRWGHKIFHVDGKDTEIMPSRLAAQGILGNGWWRYRIPGMGSINWGGVISALKEVGYDYIISIENEDPIFPGLEGCDMARRHLERFLPQRSV
jgi:sugar phosphate isomerase/epimerase